MDFSVFVPEPAPLPEDLLAGRELAFDLPIQSWAEDRLKRGRLIQSIGGLILRNKAPVVGIVGPFGEGKTSVLNLLAQSLEHRRDLVIVRFSSWLPGDEKTLMLSLFATIAEQVRSRFLVFGLGSELRRFARLLAGAVPKFGGGLSRFFEPPSQVEQLRSLKGFLDKLPVRVVVLVDELDRMDTAELLVLLKAIRGVTDLPNLSYVCAFSKKAAVRLINENDSAYGEFYLEKFFPVQIPLPRIDQELLSKFFDRKLEEICRAFNLLQDAGEKKAFSEAVNPLWRTSIKPFLTNFRRLTLFFNEFKASLGPVYEEVSLLDMMVLQLVKMASEETYEFIYDNGPLFYEPEWRIRHWEERLSVDDKTETKMRNDRLNAFFGSLADSTRARVTELLSEIFPSVDECVHAHAFSRKAVSSEEAEAKKRICHPDYFPRYFIHQVPGALFGRGEMLSFEARLNAAESVEQGVATFRKTLGELANNPWKRWDFLHNLANELARVRLGEVQSEAVVAAVAMVSESFEADLLGLGEWGRARALLFVAASRFSGTPKLQEVLSTAIREATSDGFAADILRYSTGMRKENKIITDWSEVDESAIRRAFAQRMRDKYAVGSDVEVAYDRRAEAPPFFVWASVGEEDQKLAAAFFRDRFHRYPYELGRFLAWALPKEAIYQGDPLVGLNRLFPVDELLQLINGYGDGASVGKDRESVEWIRELMQHRAEGVAGEAG
ncbi:MAG: P-loop NTPase fold protein [Candidatus Acidiferrales bacterium]